MLLLFYSPPPPPLSLSVSLCVSLSLCEDSHHIFLRNACERRSWMQQLNLYQSIPALSADRHADPKFDSSAT